MLIAAALAAPLLIGCPADQQPEHAPRDTAALRMEREGAVPDKTLPDGQVDTAAVALPGVPQGGGTVAP